MFTNAFRKLSASKLISFWLLTGPTIFIIPFLFTRSTIDPVTLPRFFVWSVLAFLSFLSVMLASRHDYAAYDFVILKRSIFYVFAGYLFVAAVSATQSISFSESFYEWLKICLSLVFFCLTCIVIDGDNSKILTLTKALVVLGLLLASIGVCQYFGLAFTSIPRNHDICATMTNKNLFASTLFLILPFVGFSICRFAGFWRMASVVVLTFSCLCIFFAGSRTVWAAIISALLFVSLVWALRNRKTVFCILCKRIDLKNCAVLLVAGLVIISLSVVAYHHREYRPFPSAGEYIKDPIQENSFVESISSLNSLNERVWLWKNTIAMVKDNPLLGVGLGQWRLAFPAYGMKQKIAGLGDGSVEIVFLRPHNDFIWVLSELGVIGFLFYLAIFAISIFYALRIFFKSNDDERQALAMAMLFGIIGYMVISFFSFPKDRIVHNILLALIMTCIVSTYHQSFPREKAGDGSKITYVRLPVLLLLIVCIVTGYVRLASETHARQALIAQREGNWQRLRAKIDDAASTFYQIDPTGVPLSWYRGIANYSTGRFQEAHDNFKYAYKIHPNHIHVLNNLGTSYAKLGDYENSIKYFKKALDIWPEFAEARINLGIIYLHVGNISEARRYLMLLNHNDKRVHISVNFEFIKPEDKNI